MAERLSALAASPRRPAAERVTLREDSAERSCRSRPGRTRCDASWASRSELLGRERTAVGHAAATATIVVALAPGRFMVAGVTADSSGSRSGASRGRRRRHRPLARPHDSVLEGEAAARVLQKSVMLDLDSAFPPGRAAQTTIHHIDVLIHRPDGDALRDLGASKLRPVARRMAARRRP